METETQSIGEYIHNWCFYHNVSRKQLQIGSKIPKYTNIFKARNISLDRALTIAEYMSSKSALPTEFYLVRLARANRGDLKKR
jgi:hypothetical protein